MRCIPETLGKFRRKFLSFYGLKLNISCYKQQKRAAVCTRNRQKPPNRSEDSICMKIVETFPEILDGRHIWRQSSPTWPRVTFNYSNCLEYVRL